MKNHSLFYAVIALMFINSAISCEDQKKPEIQGVPSHLISVKQGVVMKQEYKSKIGQLIESSNEDPNYSATQFAYIELDSLKKYIAFLEHVEKLNKKKISGLRIYFAAYPEKENPDFTSLHPGRETLFFAPTMEQKDNGNLTDEQKKFGYLRNVPFAIVPKDAKEKYVGKYKAIEGLMFPKDVRSSDSTKESAQKPVLSKFVEDNGESSLILNELNVCPPPKQQ